MDTHVARVTTVGRSKARQRFLAGLALGLVALIAELAGRSLTHRLDVGRHVGRVSYAHADYYPFLLAGVKIAVALLLAGLAWRVVKAHAAARAARRLAAALGVQSIRRTPRVRVELSARLWLLSFVDDGVDLSRPGRRRADRRRQLASPRPVAAQLCSTRLRRALGLRRRRLPDGRALALRLRGAGRRRDRARARSDEVHGRRSPLALRCAARTALALRSRVRIPASTARRLVPRAAARAGIRRRRREEEP